MDKDKKIDNHIDLSKYNLKKAKEEEPIHFESTYLSQLFKEPSDLDPLEKQKAREARFRGIKNNNTPPTGTFTK